MQNKIRKWISGRRNAIRDGLAVGITIFFTAAIGILATGYQSEKAMEAQIGDLLTTSAKSLSVLVEPTAFSALTEPSMERSETYRSLYNCIHKFGQINPIFRFAYTLRLKGDSVFFVVDGTAPGDADRDRVEDHAALLDPYPEASNIMFMVLREGGAKFDKKPYTDKWGTFQSGCASIENAEKKIIGAACVDMNITAFAARMGMVYGAEKMGLALGFCLSLTLGLAVFLLRNKQFRIQTQLLLISQDQEQKNLALLESQSQLIESQKQAGLGHWTFYTSTREMEWSDEMYRVNGHSKEKGPPSDAEYMESIKPEDRQQFAYQMQSVLDKGMAAEWFYRKILSDGSERHLFVRANPEKDTEGKVWIVRGITQDMTRWHAIETKLIKAKDKAELAAKAKSDFLAMMSHEIRTPMNGVLGMAHILKDSSLTTDQISILNTLLESGEHLLTLINDILDFSKIEAGRMEMEIIPFDLKRLSISVCDILREKATWAESTLAITYQLKDGEQYLGDPGRIRQILFNLIGNSVKFTKMGQIRLLVENATDHPGFLSISVEDTGIGMTPVQVENLFQPFTQADSSTARKYGGTGLGLAITLKLVDMMRGILTVKSTLGQGTCFRVLLPLSKVASNRDEAEHTSLGLTLPNQHGLRVLLVDDRDSSRHIIRRQLETLKMQVYEASSAVTARSVLADLLARNSFPQVGILDWRMEVEDGIDLCKSLRAQPNAAELPLILISYAAARGDAQKAREAGFDGFLVKPVPIDILAGAIYLAGKRSEPGDHPLITQHLVREMGLKLAMVTNQDSLDTVNPKAQKPPIDWTAFKPRILLAEDNLVNQKVAIRMLEKMGCHVSLAVNGIEALNMGLKDAYDLILMDCMMPEMDGYEATSAIRIREEATGKHVPIIACTANANPEEIQKTINCGMDDFVSKPYKPERLKEIVEKWATAERSMDA